MAILPVLLSPANGRWLVADAVGPSFAVVAGANGEAQEIHPPADEPYLLVLYAASEARLLFKTNPLSPQRIRSFLLEGVELNLVERPRLPLLGKGPVWRLSSFTGDNSDIEIELHPQGLSMDRALARLDAHAAEHKRALGYWIPLLAAFFSWKNFRAEDFLAANWFVQHIVENFETSLLSELEERRSQGNVALWPSQNLNQKRLAGQVAAALNEHLHGSLSRIEASVTCPSELIHGIVLLGGILRQTPVEQFAAVLKRSKLTPEARAERKEKLAYFYALWGGNQPQYRLLVWQKALPDWQSAVALMHSDYLSRAEIKLRLGDLFASVPDIVVRAVGTPGAPETDELDPQYGRGLVKQLLAEAQANRRYTPSGLYYLPLPEGMPVHDVEGLYLWVGQDRLVVRPAPFCDAFVWFPRENGLADSWSPLTLYPETALAWELLLAAVWRDLLVGGIAVEKPASETANTLPAKALPRDDQPRANRRSRRGSLRLPSTRPTEQAVLRRCTWSSEEEIERIRRLYKVRGHPRRLPPGWRRSSSAQRNAQEYGFHIPEGYTFVRPHIVGQKADAESEVETPIQALGLSSLMLALRQP